MQNCLFNSQDLGFTASIEFQHIKQLVQDEQSEMFESGPSYCVVYEIIMPLFDSIECGDWIRISWILFDQLIVKQMLLNGETFR